MRDKCAQKQEQYAHMGDQSAHFCPSFARSKNRTAQEIGEQDHKNEVSAWQRDWDSAKGPMDKKEGSEIFLLGGIQPVLDLV